MLIIQISQLESITQSMIERVPRVTTAADFRYADRTTTLGRIVVL